MARIQFERTEFLLDNWEPVKPADISTIQMMSVDRESAVAGIQGYMADNARRNQVAKSSIDDEWDSTYKRNRQAAKDITKLEQTWMGYTPEERAALGERTFEEYLFKRMDMDTLKSLGWKTPTKKKP